jgi:hypothetical protein
MSEELVRYTALPAETGRQQQRLASSGLSASVGTDGDGGIVRLGPLAHDAVWIALKAFPRSTGA